MTPRIREVRSGNRQAFDQLLPLVYDELHRLAEATASVARRPDVEHDSARPRGLPTIQHEEQFYLRQPAYGGSYVIGKIQIETLIAEYARQREDRFVLAEFMDEFNRAGVIPVSLIYWELTGDRSMLDKTLDAR